MTGDSFTGSLTRVSGENARTYTIQQGTLALSTNYVLTYVGANLTVTKRAVTVTADGKSKVHGDPDRYWPTRSRTASLIPAPGSHRRVLAR